MKTLLTFLFLVLTSGLYSQKILNDAMTFNNLPDKINVLKRTSSSIEVSDKNFKKINLLGSGFLTMKNDIFYAVSNYHVIKNVTKDQVILIGMNLDQKSNMPQLIQFTQMKNMIM